MSSKQTVLEEIRLGILPEVLAEKIPWEALSRSDITDLLKASRQMNSDRQSYQLLVYLFRISSHRDLWFSVEVLAQAVQHPIMTPKDRQSILWTLRGRLDRIRNEISAAPPPEEDLRKYWLMEASYYVVNSATLAETGHQAEADQNQQIAQGIFEQLGLAQQSSRLKGADLTSSEPPAVKAAEDRPTQPRPSAPSAPAKGSILARAAASRASQTTIPAAATPPETAAQDPILKRVAEKLAPQPHTPPEGPTTPLAPASKGSILKRAVESAVPPKVAVSARQASPQPAAPLTPLETPPPAPTPSRASEPAVLPKEVTIPIRPVSPPPAEPYAPLVVTSPLPPTSPSASQPAATPQEALPPPAASTPPAAVVTAPPAQPKADQPPAAQANAAPDIYQPLPDVWLKEGQLYVQGLRAEQNPDVLAQMEQIQRHSEILAGIQLQIQMYLERRARLDREVKALEARAAILKTECARLEKKIKKSSGAP